MRIIKFRVWDDQRKQFRDDAISFQFEENNIVEVSFENGEDHFIKKDGFISYPSSQIQQFTGLHDKNGKEIFEGDIISYSNGKIWKNNKWDTNYDVFEVIYKDYYFQPFNKFHLGKNFYKSIEIIGNIFENADLIKL